MLQKIKIKRVGQVVCLIVANMATVANAHMTVVSSEASAGWYYDAAIGVPHGCSDPNSTATHKLPNWDTYKVEINVPKSFKHPRPYDNEFGKASISETNDFYVLTWTRDDNYKEYETDSHAYKMHFKTKLPKGNYQTHYLPAIQYCHKNGVETKSEWIGKTHGGPQKPAPKLVAYPKNRFAGWNKFSIQNTIKDLSVFNNAQIVWVGQSAYSPNPVIAEMIKNDTSVTELKSIPANTKVWVKY